MPTDLSPLARELLSPWGGPGDEEWGGLPPLDRVEPGPLEEAMQTAIEAKRAEVRAIAADPAPASFVNTCELLEDCGRALRRLVPLYAVHSSSRSLGEMPAVAQRIAPRLSALDDEIAHDEQLFARVEAVWQRRETLTAEQRRLVEVQRERMRRNGAGLPSDDKCRLAAIRARLAALGARYHRNLIEAAQAHAVFLDDAAELDGLDETQRRAAADAALTLGRPDAWAIPNARGAVWAFLTHATGRAARERVWRMWNGRGDPVNVAVAAEMLQLRGELAKIMGAQSYAHLALADRMARTPETATELLDDTWTRVKPLVDAQLASYRSIAERDGLEAPLEPWDRQFYAEKLRRERFAVDADEIRNYLPLEAVLEAMFWAAGRVHRLTFERLSDAPRIDPEVRVYGVRRDGKPFGVVYFDLMNRPGKMHGSYQYAYRDAEAFRGAVLPVCSVNSSFQPPPAGHPVLLPWEYANVFFHEFGHALHMLFNATSYPSLASQNVAWDFVELPALLNERWLRDRELLQRHARHHETGEAMPGSLVDRIDAALRHDRIFSLNPDYLLPAIIDLRLHLLADGSGRSIDPVAVEEETLRQLGMPPAWDLVMRVTSNYHVFANGGTYAAGLYSYLWSDVLAADAAAVFERSPGGLYDEAVSRAWIGKVLSVGHRVPADTAFADFAGGAPDASPLHERFGLRRPGQDRAGRDSCNVSATALSARR